MYRYVFENSLTNSASVGLRYTRSSLIWPKSAAAAAAASGVGPAHDLGQVLDLADRLPLHHPLRQNATIAASGRRRRSPIQVVVPG